MSLLEAPLLAEGEVVLRAFMAAAQRLALAESCTGGLIAAAITAWPGSSAVFERGFVTYANEAKTEMLGVPASLIAAHGAVSAEVAAAMATGALMHSRADVAVSVTGIAGPAGESADKPVGLVFIGGANRVGAVTVERHVFVGTRAEVRTQAGIAGLKLAVAILSPPLPLPPAAC